MRLQKIQWLVAVVLTAVFATVGCANTVRGIGADAANTIDATQNAGKRLGRAARN